MSNVTPIQSAWLTRSELATELHVSTRTIDRWVAEGMPSETWGRRLRRFNLSRCLKWLSERSVAA